MDGVEPWDYGNSSRSIGITGAIFQNQKRNGHYGCQPVPNHFLSFFWFVQSFHKSTFVGNDFVFDGIFCRKLSLISSALITSLTLTVKGI